MTNARAGKKVGRESGRAADFQWGKIIGVKCRRILTLMASIVLISISVAGCGQESDRSAVERPGKSTEWTAETVDLPPYLSVSGETSFGDDFYYIGYTGTESAFEAKIYRMDMGEAAPVPVELPYRSDQDLDREEYLDLAIDAEGNLVLLTGQSAVNGGDPAITDVTWKRIDQEGGVVATGSVMEYFADTAYPVPTGMAIDGAGNLYFYQGKILVVVDKAGALLMETTVENDITSIFTDQSGAVNLLAFNVNINTMEVYTIDPVAGAAELSYSLPQGEVYFDVVGNDDGNLVLISDRGVYDFLVDTQAINTRLEWSSINISTDYMGRFLPLSDGRMLWVGKSYQGEKEQVELSLIRPMTAEEAAAQAAEQSESTTMTVGGLSFLIDGMVREAVVDFNKNNEDCQIEIVEYGAEDIQAGVVQLNADIVAGNAPDVMLLPIGYSLDSYIGLGVLEDMYPYLLQDETVSMADLQENVLRAYETDGQLFGLPISYQIVTLMGQGSLLDGRTSWTMEELMDFTARHQANSTIFDNSTQAGVLHICLVGSGQQLIDPASGALDRELMIQMLEYAKPFTPDAEYNGGMNEEQIMERASDGRIFLFNTQVNSPHNYQMYSTLYGEPISYVGYPGAAGSGTLVDSNMLFGINSNSELKAEAWDFISSMLTEKVQDSPMMFNIPVRRSVMETRLERAMEENSNGLLSYGTIQMEMLPVGEKEAQMYRDLIDSVDRRADFDEQIERIIAEESAGYFSGDRTALEATDVIENRVGTYLAESR